MLRYLVPLILMLSSANSWHVWSPKHHVPRPKVQVASESQVKFALENKYDDTGPGAKQPEYAYNTYKNLEDALIGYLDDPDTKLPEHDRYKAINKLTNSDQYVTHHSGRLFQKDDRINTLGKPQIQDQNILSDVFNHPVSKLVYSVQDSKVGKIGTIQQGNDLLGLYEDDMKPGPFKLQKIQTVKGNPLSLAHYTRDPDLKLTYEQFDPHPRYTFSYGVHDKTTGDSKTAQESRDGGNVRGFYSFIDSDGKTRTVHYRADDRQGFRASVHKI